MEFDGLRPDVGFSKRNLQFLWVCDCSSSMAINGKIESLNEAIKQSVDAMKEVANENPAVQVYVRTMKFADTVEWIEPEGVKLENFQWSDLVADGCTSLGRACEMISDFLNTSKIGRRAIPPVIVLLTDGMPTDDFDKGLKALLDTPWGMRAIKIAIAIGDNVDLDLLQRFIDSKDRVPLVAKNAGQLTDYIQWVSTVLIKDHSESKKVTTSEVEKPDHADSEEHSREDNQYRDNDRGF